jgi:hypothetical protein
VSVEELSAAEERERFWVRVPDHGFRGMTGVVYFVSAGDDGPIKVGFTGGALRRRLADLQVTSPVRLRVIFAVKGGQPEERKTHRELREHRLHGEWFERSAVLAYLDLHHRADMGIRLVKGGKR